MESKTQKSILLNGTALSYELERKKVKNINLRVKPDGTVHVSASRWHSMRSIEALLYANADKIPKLSSAISSMYSKYRQEGCPLIPAGE